MSKIHAAPAFVAAHQEQGTCQRLAAGMLNDEGEYKVRGSTDRHCTHTSSPRWYSRVCFFGTIEIFVLRIPSLYVWLAP